MYCKYLWWFISLNEQGDIIIKDQNRILSWLKNRYWTLHDWMIKIELSMIEWSNRTFYDSIFDHRGFDINLWLWKVQFRSFNNSLYKEGFKNFHVGLEEFLTDNKVTRDKNSAYFKVLYIQILPFGQQK
jgi:hypothetical protein